MKREEMGTEQVFGRFQNSKERDRLSSMRTGDQTQEIPGRQNRKVS